MFFFLPIGVEGGQVRLPVVSIGILLLCCLTFVASWVVPENPEGVDRSSVQQGFQYWKTRPYLDPPASLNQRLPEAAREQLAAQKTAWLESHALPEADVLAKEQAELDALFAVGLSDDSSLLMRLALKPSRGPAQIGWLTHMFIHFGWLHLIFNMLFFYICAPLLEDAWGRSLFGVFFVVGGLFAAAAHYAVSLGSTQAMGGASGAVAALMGAFAVRFARRKISLAYFFFAGFRLFRGVWNWPAWVCGLLWFGGEVFSWLVGGNSGGVAVMAHIGGFAFGSLAALGMKAIGLEKALVATDEAHIGPLEPSVLAEVEEARKLLFQSNPEGARAAFEAGLKRAPDDIDAAMGLVSLDLDAGRRAEALARLETALNKPLRAKESRLALNGLFQVWSKIEPHELKPMFASALARAADELQENYVVLLESLYDRATLAPGMLGARALMRSAELKGQSPDARPYLERLLAMPDAGVQLTAQAKKLLETVPTTRAISLEETPAVTDSFVPPTIFPCALQGFVDAGLQFDVAGQGVRTVAWSKLIAIAAGVVPVQDADGKRRGVLQVDLILKWGEGAEPASALRFDSDTTSMTQHFPGGSAAEVYGGFFRKVFEQSQARGQPNNEVLVAGKFPRFESAEARDRSVYGAL